MPSPLIKELKPEELKSEYSLSAFNFQTTEDLLSEDKMVGQVRAIKALEFGLRIKRAGYNLYVAGIPGTGRNTMILKAVREIAAREAVPDDVCYLFNFEKSDEPKAVKLPSGKGSEFQQDMGNFIKNVEHDVAKAFVSEDYEKHKTTIVEKFEKEKQKLNDDLDKFAAEQGFVIERAMTGILVVPLSQDHEMTEAEYSKLSAKEKSEIKRKQDEVYERLYALSHSVKEVDRALRNNLEELDRSVGLFAVQSLIAGLKKKYSGFPTIVAYLEDVKNDILENLEAFKKESAGASPLLASVFSSSREDILFKYQVNLLVDHQKTKGAPVIIEDNPTYYNLIGRIEHKVRLGILTTDFSMIKAGAIHKANGGYLIIQANDLFKNYFAWDALKSIIKIKKVKIENVAERYGYLPTAGLKPEAVDVNLKIIMIGNPYIYYLLRMLDEDFIKTFKVKVDFDNMLQKTDHIVLGFINFLSGKCREEGFLPFNKPAVEQVLNVASRLISHQNKISARFAEMVDLMREADFWAREEKASCIDVRHVKKAVKEKVYRSDMIEHKIRELFEEGTLRVETQGAKVGQVNGISVLDVGDYVFGIPSRITSRTYLGKGNIINIERETEMSGRIHSKGILIISGFLGHKFAQDKPLAVSASICFEQTYEEVEGDSASSAEIYSLLSSLGDIPLKQSIAVTGSVDQLGNVQAVGGINEKIEGFFEVCRLKGLDGHGVLIPETNVKNLMLKDEVIDAVKNNKFHIYPVRTINEGIAVLSGLEAGEKDAQGNYPSCSVYHQVNERLKGYVDIVMKMDKEIPEQKRS